MKDAETQWGPMQGRLTQLRRAKAELQVAGPSQGLSTCLYAASLRGVWAGKLTGGLSVLEVFTWTIEAWVISLLRPLPALLGRRTYMVMEQFKNNHIYSQLAGKEPSCNAGDPSLVPEWGSSPREGIGYPLQNSWASLVSQTVKNPPAMWETWVPS